MLGGYSIDVYTYETTGNRDRLAWFNGECSVYDSLGNPTMYRCHDLEWTKVRKLAKFDANTFEYNASGIRFKKNNTVYTLDGDRILKETDGTKTITYYYGNGNAPIGFNYNGTDYYYRKNIQGDVVRIYNARGYIVARYVYDAWGNHKIYDANNDEVTSTSHIGYINPIRYRGYYFDAETNLYYLQTRYYDPEIGRFLNSDAIEYLAPEQLGGLNLYAYCNDNPVMLLDIFGLCAKAWAAGYQGPCPGYGQPGCMDNWFQGESNFILTIDPNIPPDHPDYIPPKKGGGKKVKNPNGNGWGWPAKDGGVWVPTPNMHGGEGWTIQYPGGDHSHAYPGGGVRNHFQVEQSTGTSIIMTVGGALLTVGLIVDNVTGIGVADDSLLVGSTTCFIGGLDGMFGKKVCTVCGVVIYGY